MTGSTRRRRSAVSRRTDVTAGYGDRVALTDVDLDIPTGSLLAVIGPNGSGKSTLLKTISGVLAPFSGSVEVFGGPPKLSAKRIAYVPRPSSSTGRSRSPSATWS